MNAATRSLKVDWLVGRFALNALSCVQKVEKVASRACLVSLRANDIQIRPYKIPIFS
jgi:hypothetical protein